MNETIKSFLIGLGIGFIGIITFLVTGTKSRRNDYNRNLGRVDDELGHQRDLAGRERDSIERERESVGSERDRLGQERDILDRDRELIDELKNRVKEDGLV